MQRPVLKDGVVVNVIVIGDDVEVVTKAEHKALMAEEDAAHAAALVEWRAEVNEMRAEFVAAEDLKTLNELMARPLPSKPQLVRGNRWFHPEGLELGPPGGNIGDLWDGTKYIMPEGKTTGPDPK